MVLFVFVIMLVRLYVALQQFQFARQKWGRSSSPCLAGQVGVNVLDFRENARAGCRY